MIFIKNGTEYPRHVGDIEIDNPGWELGQALPEGWAVVVETTAPAAGSGQVVKEVAPQFDGTNWVQTWEVVILTADEILGLQAQEFDINSKNQLLHPNN